MADATEVFFAAWSVADRDSRIESIENAFSSRFAYADPRTPEPIESVEALADYIGAFIEAAPDATAKVIKSDMTSEMQRATVAFTMANGMIQYGQYFINFDDDNKIRQMTGFVGTGAVE